METTGTVIECKHNISNVVPDYAVTVGSTTYLISERSDGIDELKENSEVKGKVIGAHEFVRNSESMSWDNKNVFRIIKS